ncbi:reverse transcriptase domain-containing protein [Tanacetum coccineum]|uniref:Reverse transcriptase domain-containing protein n=1 Tax=Tanacetum coccineum TaxID=301880 RepID=A0ABQ5GF28_9ASTR
MQMIWDNQFDGRIRSDPHQHITNFLEISNRFQYVENQEEAIKLRAFPFSLSGEAKTWLFDLNEGTITLWNELREAFVSRYFSPTKFRCLLNEIHNFHQLDPEILIKAWLRMKEMLHTCYGHGDFQNNPKPKTIVSSGGSNIIPDHELLTEKFEALATKIDSDFLKIREELKES